MILRPASLAVLGILFASITVAAFAPAPVYKPRVAKSGDLLAAMQGDWERDPANKTKGKSIALSKVHIEGNKWTFASMLTKAGRSSPIYDIVLDKAKTPVQIELTLSSIPPATSRVVLKGIVKLEDDLLTIRYVTGAAAASGQIPKSFNDTQTASGTRVHTMTLKRVK